MKIEQMAEWKRDAHNRREYDRRMSKDHRKDKAQKDDVKHSIVTGPGLELRREEKPHHSTGDEPAIARQQANRHITRQPIVANRKPGNVVAQKPDRQSRQTDSCDANPRMK